MDDVKGHRIQPVDPKQAFGRNRRLVGDIQAKRGLVPNLFWVLRGKENPVIGMTPWIASHSITRGREQKECGANA